MEEEVRKMWADKANGKSIIVSKDRDAFILYDQVAGEVIVYEHTETEELKENMLRFMDNMLRSKFIQTVLCNNDQLVEDLNTRMNKFAGIQKVENMHEEYGIMFHKYVFDKIPEGR